MFDKRNTNSQLRNKSIVLAITFFMKVFKLRNRNIQCTPYVVFKKRHDHECPFIMLIIIFRIICMVSTKKYVFTTMLFICFFDSNYILYTNNKQCLHTKRRSMFNFCAYE